MFRSELDHLVVASAHLDEGVDWVERQLGARPQPGGQHVAMGTHNALLKLGPRCYLEVIAIDPDGVPPARPRWFALDEPAMQSRLASGPALITWVLRCESLADACARVPDLGEITVDEPRRFSLEDRRARRWQSALGWHSAGGDPVGAGARRESTASLRSPAG